MVTMGSLVIVEYGGKKVPALLLIQDVLSENRPYIALINGTTYASIEQSTFVKEIAFTEETCRWAHEELTYYVQESPFDFGVPKEFDPSVYEKSRKFDPDVRATQEEIAQLGIEDGILVRPAGERGYYSLGECWPWPCEDVDRPTAYFACEGRTDTYLAEEVRSVFKKAFVRDSVQNA